MVFITHFLKNQLTKSVAWLLCASLLALSSNTAQSQIATPEVSMLRIERQDDGLWLTAQLRFDLPNVVEDALNKGIPIIFVAEADLLRERWYWSNKKVTSAKRRIRLAYQPLTRRWRVNMDAGEISATSLGLALNQTFDSLPDALSSVRRISHWKVAEVTDIEADSRHSVGFRFYLDLTQLPRPLQIGTLGQSDWSISFSSTQTLGAASAP
jgi:hypothetical protein